MLFLGDGDRGRRAIRSRTGGRDIWNAATFFWRSARQATSPLQRTLAAKIRPAVKKAFLQLES
jgi:hypothetical protein